MDRIFHIVLIEYKWNFALISIFNFSAFIYYSESTNYKKPWFTDSRFYMQKSRVSILPVIETLSEKLQTKSFTWTYLIVDCFISSSTFRLSTDFDISRLHINDILYKIKKTWANDEILVPSNEIPFFLFRTRNHENDNFTFDERATRSLSS